MEIYFLPILFLGFYGLTLFFYGVCTKQLELIEDFSELTNLLLKTILVFYVSMLSVHGTLYVSDIFISKLNEYVETKNRIKDLVFKGLAFESMQSHIKDIETLLQLEESINNLLKEQQERFFREHMYQKKEPDAHI